MNTQTAEKQKFEPLYRKEELQDGKMYVRIKDIAYIYASHAQRDFFKGAIGLYMEVETSHLFNNQYNTKTLRIYDSMIDEVIGDVRAQWCKNKYTGAMVRVGEEQKYLDSQAAKAHQCKGCFWNRRTLVSEEKTQSEPMREVIVKNYTFKCDFKDGKTDCTHTEAAQYGFDYFTAQNTYFLMYPTGSKSGEAEKLVVGMDNALKVGSYRLEYYPSLFYFRLSNCRQTINFRFDGSNFWIHNGIGLTKAKYLSVPDKVNAKVKQFLITAKK